ncbi:MAG: hypothetical protein R6U44_02765 [Archaeoglobaceae archaeon]
MERKIVRAALLALAILAIGVLVLPSTVTLFAGQHTWYYKEALPCEKCHADVADEFQSSANYHPPGNTYPVWEACVLCHQVEPLYPGDVSQEAGKHAATVVPCDYCHYPEATAFDNDPHYPFVKAAEEDDQMPNGTEACVACHTHAEVKINFTWKKYMTFGFEVNADGDRDDPNDLGGGTDLLTLNDTTNYGTSASIWNATDGFGANGTETHYVVDYGAFVSDRDYNNATPFNESNPEWGSELSYGDTPTDAEDYGNISNQH